MNIGNVEVGNGFPPRLVCVIGRSPYEEAESAKRQKANLLEVRLDYTSNRCSGSDLRLLKQLRNVGLPIVATIRRVREWGRYVSDEDKRRNRLVAIVESGFADAVDIELDADPSTIYAVTRARAESSSVRIIASYHNYSTTVPSDSELEEFASKAAQIGGDITKLAVLPHDREETIRFLEFGKRLADRYTKRTFVFIATGALGQLSRVVGNRYGSSLMYTNAMGIPYAAGQLPIAFYNKISGKNWLPENLSTDRLRYLQFGLAPA